MGCAQKERNVHKIRSFCMRPRAKGIDHGEIIANLESQISDLKKRSSLPFAHLKLESQS